MQVTKMNDGAYENFVTGLGNAGMDKGENTLVKGYTGSNVSQLAFMKMQDGIASGVVERPVESAFKHDISIIGDDDGKIFKELQRAGVIEAICEAGEYIRLCGGAIVVKEYEGEFKADLKSDPPKNAKISNLRVFSSAKIELNNSDFDGDRIKTFRVTLLDKSRVEINPSRCVVFKGIKAPDCVSGLCLREAFFGTPALKKCESSIKDLATVFGSVVNMAAETGAMVFSLEGFNEMLSKPDSGVSDAQNLMDLVKLSMNSMRAVFAGQNDKVEIKSHNFAGIPEILQKCINRVSADSRIPVSILFGQSASGLAQTNKADTQAFDEMVESWRNRYLYRPSCELISDFAKRNLGRDVSEFEWGPVSVMSIEEELTAKKTQMEIVEKAITLGIITPDEARQPLFVNGHSWNITVEGEIKGVQAPAGEE